MARGAVAIALVLASLAAAAAGAAGTTAVSPKRVWLLPRSGAVATAATRRDEELSAQLATLGRAFAGWAGVYVQNLATGRFASLNADASFLAASTVKLGVMIETLRHYGPFPERSAVWGDIAAMISLSSNDAANRVFLRLGNGSESAAAALLLARFRAIGAASTTFPGTYRLSQARAAGRVAGAGRALDAPAHHRCSPDGAPPRATSDASSGPSRPPRSATPTPSTAPGSRCTRRGSDSPCCPLRGRKAGGSTRADGRSALRRRTGRLPRAAACRPQSGRGQRAEHRRR